MSVRAPRVACLRAPAGLCVALLVLGGCTGGASRPPASSGSAAETVTALPSGRKTTAPSVAYRPYVNGRYGFGCDVPATFTAGHEPANGDGLGFTDPSGQVQLVCSGVNNSDQLAPHDAFLQALQYAQQDGKSVTLQTQPGDAYTISGTTRDGEIFYEHTVVGPGSENTIYWTYPPAQKQALDAVVQHSVQTFRPGDTSVSH